jgi:Tol biopolymer transport system component
LAIALVAAQSRSAADQYQEALRLEEVKGDLNAAIEQYTKLAQGADRAIAAKALVQLAGCYEKLGLNGARTAYERVVREFADQARSATTARTRLAAMQSAGVAQVGQSVRLLWSDLRRAQGYNSGLGAPSADGRYLSFSQDRQNNGDAEALGILDLRTGRTTSATDPPAAGGEVESPVVSPNGQQVAYGGEVESSVVSPNGQQVAYVRTYGGGRPCELRAVQVNGGRAGKSRLVLRDRSVCPLVTGWSPNGKSVVFATTNRRQIAVISMADGAVRVLKDNLRLGGGATFSPDGRHVAYHAQIGTGTAVNRDIFVVTMDSGETRIVEAPGDDRSPMWSPDGSHIVFVSDRTGSLSLWMIPVAGGTPTGPARIVRADVASPPPSGHNPVIPADSFIPLGITRSGALYYVAGSATTNVNTADLDANLNVAREPSIATNRYINSSSAGVWSPDGESLAYHATSALGVLIRIRSVKTDDDREVPTGIPISGPVRWFPDGQSLLVPSRDVRIPNGLMGYYRVNIASGNAELLHQTASRNIVSTRPDLSADGKTVFYLETPQQPVRFDLDSRRETKLTPVSNGVSLAVSPDGTQIAYILAENSGRGPAGSLAVAPAAGGESREVLRFSDEPRPNAGLVASRFQEGLGLAWSPDQRYLFFVRPRISAIWRVPVAGGEAENIGVSMNGIRALRVHPDGRRIAFDSVVDAPSEVWVLENFLPKARAVR